MATHSGILVWRIPWTEEPGEGYSPWDHKESDTTEQLIHTHLTHTYTHTHRHGLKGLVMDDKRYSFHFPKLPKY